MKILIPTLMMRIHVMMRIYVVSSITSTLAASVPSLTSNANAIGSPEVRTLLPYTSAIGPSRSSNAGTSSAVDFQFAKLF